MTHSTKPAIRIEKKWPNLVLLQGLTVNYDLAPSEAIERGLPGNDPRIADYPQELWTNGKSGIVESVTIPLYVLPVTRTTLWARKMQSGIGFGSPAEVAAINSAIRTNGYLKLELLRNMHLSDFVSLGEVDSSLWQDPQTSKPLAVGLHLNYLPQQPTPSGFYLLPTVDSSWAEKGDLPTELPSRWVLVGAAFAA